MVQCKSLRHSAALALPVVLGTKATYVVLMGVQGMLSDGQKIIWCQGLPSVLLTLIISLRALIFLSQCLKQELFYFFVCF